MKLGKSERKALDFAMRVLIEKEGDFEKSWHTFSKDADTKRIIHSLAKKRLVEVYKPGKMFRITTLGSIIARQLSQKTRTNPTSFYDSESPEKREARLKRKSTTHEYIVQGYYSGSWEDVDAHDNRWDAIQSRKNYDENERSVPHRIVKYRIKSVRPNPSRGGLLQIERKLKRRAKRMGLRGERARAYIYGTYGRIKRASGY